MKDVLQYWLDLRSEKLSKDKKYKDGELYFEVSDVENNVLTFKQFIHFITKGTSETMSGKVIRYIIIREYCMKYFKFQNEEIVFFL